MYGKPLEPNKALFHISTPEEFAEEQGDDEEYVVSMFIVDMDEPDNDNIRDIKHPDFDRYWGNTMKIVSKFMTKVKIGHTKKHSNGVYQ